MSDRPNEKQVCDEILAIMRVYHEQWPNISTPGGFEHMGDVWSQFLKWESLLLAGQSRATQEQKHE